MRLKHPIWALLAGGLILLGCVEGVGFGAGAARPVLQGGFTIDAPTGYCMDAKASRETADSGIYLIGRCRQNSPVAPALISVSVGAPGSAGVMLAGGEELAAFFTSDEGRATLSASGEASAVRVLEARSTGDTGEIFVMRLQERGGPDYWRAIMGTRGRLVSVSVRAAGDDALASESGREVLDRAIASLQRANRL
jgi:hypothetical protein